MHAQEDNSKPKIEWRTEYHLVPFYVFLEKETLVCSFFLESEMSVNSDITAPNFGTPVLRKFAEVTEVCGSSSKTFKMDSNCPISSRNWIKKIHGKITSKKLSHFSIQYFCKTNFLKTVYGFTEVFQKYL